jgi:hypothetical protein
MSKTKNKSKRSGKNDQGPVIALGVGVVAIIGFLVFSVVQSNRMAEQNRVAQELLRPNQYGCTSSPVRAEMPGLEREICKSQGHVAPGEQVAYETDPPLSGQHSGTWVNPGFYEEPQMPEELVHSLEHGHVVIYYDAARLSPEELSAVRALAQKYRGNWDGVVAVPRTDPEHAIILTAWERGLRLTGYDVSLVDQFVDLFRGRGPENPVRPLS